MKFALSFTALAAFSVPSLAAPYERGLHTVSRAFAKEAPFAKRANTTTTTSTMNVTDVDVLQFALTLEHLENVYYKQGLAKFTQQDFTQSNFSASYFDNVKFIAHDEEAHVVFLEGAISATGATPVGPCTYKFGNALDDVKSFAALGSVLEGVGVSAYLGGAPVIQSKAILAQAGGVLVSEGLHQGVQRQALGETASANIAGTGISPNGILTLALAFITSCPSNNAALPFKAFPTLNAVTVQPNAPNATQQFDVGGAIPEPFFVTFVSGLDTLSVLGTQAAGLISVAIPATTQGQAYAFITKSAINGTLEDSDVLFGPAVLEVTPDAPTIDFNLRKRGLRTWFGRHDLGPLEA